MTLQHLPRGAQEDGGLRWKFFAQGCICAQPLAGLGLVLE